MSGLQPTASASLRRAHPFLSDVRAASNALRPYIRPATVRRSPAYTGAFGVQRGELSIKKIFREFPPLREFLPRQRWGSLYSQNFVKYRKHFFEHFKLQQLQGGFEYI